MHAGTNLGPPFNRSASSLTPSKTLALWFFSPSCHCSHACSSFSFSSLLFLSLFFCWSTLLCFIPTSPLWLHFNPLILITRFVVSCRPPPPHILLSSVPTFASCTCLSGFCLFIPSSADAFLLLTFSSFPPLGSSLYLFLWVFSLYRHP